MSIQFQLLLFILSQIPKTGFPAFNLVFYFDAARPNKSKTKPNLSLKMPLSDWITTQMDDGRKLYTNVVTKKSQFSPPEELENVTLEFEVKELNLKVTELQKSLAEMQKQMNCGLSKIYTPVKIQFGTVPSNSQIALVVPKSIPETAREIKVVMAFQSGSCSLDKSFFIIAFTKESNGVAYEMPMLAHTCHQNAWSYNSDSDWLPLTQERVVYVKTDAALTANASGTISIVGYR